MSSNRFRDNRRKANVIDTSQVEVANAPPATPEAAIRYDPATRGFSIKIDKGIPIQKLIGQLKLYAAVVEVEHVASIADGAVVSFTQASAPTTIAMQYDFESARFTNSVDGERIPDDELVAFLQILLTALSIGPAAELQMQMMQHAAQQQAQGVTLATEMPPEPNFR